MVESIELTEDQKRHALRYAQLCLEIEQKVDSIPDIWDADSDGALTMITVTGKPASGKSLSCQSLLRKYIADVRSRSIRNPTDYVLGMSPGDDMMQPFCTRIPKSADDVKSFIDEAFSKIQDGEKLLLIVDDYNSLTHRVDGFAEKLTQEVISRNGDIVLALTGTSDESNVRIHRAPFRRLSSPIRLASGGSNIRHETTHYIRLTRSSDPE